MAETTTQRQIVSESPGIEAYKIELLKLAKQRGEIPVDLPEAQVAGFTPEQQTARLLAARGIGAYEPYMAGAGEAYQTAARGYAAVPSYGMEALEAVRQGANISTGLSTQATQAYDPQSAVAFMNPYQQRVTEEATNEMRRQADIARAQQSAQSVRTGSFGGSRQGVQASELARNLADIQSKRIFEDYSTNFSQAQAAAMNAFQNQQSRLQQASQTALGAGTAIGQAAISGGQLQQGAATGIGGLGQQTAALGQQISGLGQGDASFLYNLGEKTRGYEQSVIDAARQSAIQQEYEPFQRISFLSDIYKGAPSSQQTISQTTAPSPSLASQAGGLGIAALSAYNLFGGGKSGAGG
jgi:hypothetical protein